VTWLLSACTFAPSDEVPAPFRATNDDYRGSGLTRGHMAPAGAHKQSQAALDGTFKLSANILPQEYTNNASDWLRLERWSRGLIKHGFDDVYVISGPLFLSEALPAAMATKPAVSPPAQAQAAGTKAAAAPPSVSKWAPPVRRRVTYDVVGAHEVAVPTHLFKVVLAERRAPLGGVERRLSAFITPNGPVRGHPDLDDFEVPLAEVERTSGLLLFPKLGDAVRPSHRPSGLTPPALFAAALSQKPDPARSCSPASACAQRYMPDAIPPLCGPAVSSRCGVGAMDGIIKSAKLQAHLKLAPDCAELQRAWEEAAAGSSKELNFLKKTYNDVASELTCPLQQRK
jgi:DNA/RNA endonuclease G (NUC1)